MPLLTHDDLIELGTLLDYPWLDGGVCHGFSYMLAQAILIKVSQENTKTPS